MADDPEQQKKLEDEDLVPLTSLENIQSDNLDDGKILAVFNTEVEHVAKSIPLIKPLKAHPAVTLLTFFTLLGFGFLGVGPSTPLAPPPKKDFLKDGKAPPVEFDFEADTFHSVKSDDLQVEFNYEGNLSKVTFSGTESGARSKPEVLFDQGRSLRLEITSEDDAEDSIEGLIDPNALRLLDDGILVRREFIDGLLSSDTTILIGKDEEGKDRRYLDYIVEIKNNTDDEMSFNYTLSVLEGLTLPFKDGPFIGSAAFVTDENGEPKIERMDFTREHFGDFVKPAAIASMTRYGLAALKVVDLGEIKGRLKGKIPVGQNPDGLELHMKMDHERIKLPARATLRHHYRLILGQRSAWTLAGHGEPDLGPVTSDSWPINHFFRELELDFLRGFLSVIPSQGLALLFIGILTAMLLRPMNMTSNWSSQRMGSLRPVIAHINKRRGEVIRSLETHESKKKARQIVSETVSKLYKDHGIRPGLGCLMWIIIFPVLIGFYSAIDSGCALKGTEFLWIKDLALPDNFYPLQEPLVDIDLLRGMANDPNVTLPPYSFSFTYFKMDSIHLLPILLYTLPWVETIILRLMGIKAPFRILSTLIFFVIFMWFFYSLPAGAHLGFLTVRLVWATDRIRLARYLQKGYENLASPAEADPNHSH